MLTCYSNKSANMRKEDFDETKNPSALTDILPPADAESYEWRDFSPEGFAPAHIE